MKKSFPKYITFYRRKSENVGIVLRIISYCFLFQTSIIVSDLVKKFWSKELSAVDLRNEGNKLFQRGEVKEK